MKSNGSSQSRPHYTRSEHTPGVYIPLHSCTELKQWSREIIPATAKHVLSISSAAAHLDQFLRLLREKRKEINALQLCKMFSSRTAGLSLPCWAMLRAACSEFFGLPQTCFVQHDSPQRPADGDRMSNAQPCEGTHCRRICPCHGHQESEMVTLMPRLPLSANSWAMLVSKTRQSLLMMAAWTPSWMLRGVASQVSRRLWPLSSRR